MKGGRLGWGIGAVSAVHVCSNASTPITIITMHMVARALAAAAGGWQAPARRPDDPHDANWHLAPKKGRCLWRYSYSSSAARTERRRRPSLAARQQQAAPARRGAGSWGAGGGCAPHARPLHDSTQSHGSDSTHRLCESSRLNSSAL
jgi:hypothetical protein